MRSIVLRKVLRYVVCCQVASLLVCGADRGEITPAERSYLTQQLRTSEEAVLKGIEGLTSAQWTFKPAPEAWSVQECVEHLIKAEDLLFAEAQKVLKTAPVARLANATPEGDREIVAQMEHRTQKAKAPQALVPTGTFATPALAGEAFKQRRDRTIQFIEATQEPLRIHAAPGPAGPTADVYQFLLLIAAHSMRHAAQIKEVESNSAFPVRPSTL